jgi:hypothetical protein
VEAFQAQLHGARWLWGGCDDLLTPRSLGPLFDIAAQAGGQLAALCGQGAGQDQVFGAFLAELNSPAGFTVAVIEDVHWADEATIDLLRFTGRRLGRMTALVLVTYRDDELVGDRLRLLLGDLATCRAPRRMGLPPLSEEAVRALAGRRGMDAAELCQVTGGNPFLVCEAIEAGWPTVPSAVHDAVGARLARAPAPVREAVQAAAVIGTSNDRELLVAVVGGSAALLDDCLRTGLLSADAGCLRFRHELIGMAVEEAIGPHRRRELHARVLAVLQDAGNSDPAVLARHAEGADDVAAIRRHALDAARRSAALGAHRDAAAHYQRALRYADTADRPGLAGLQEGLAAEYLLLDRPGDSEAALRTALQHRRGLRDNVRVGEDLSMLADVLWQQCRGEESGWAAEESLRVLQQLPPGPELAVAHAGVARSTWDAGRRTEALDGIAWALDLGQALRRDDVVSPALTLTGAFLADRGQDGTGSIQRALQLALAAGLEQQRPMPTPACRSAASACTGSRTPSVTTAQAWPSASGASCPRPPAACKAPTPARCCCSGDGMRPPESAPACLPPPASHRPTSCTRCGSSAPSAAAAANRTTLSYLTRRPPWPPGPPRRNGSRKPGRCGRNCCGHLASLRPPTRTSRAAPVSRVAAGP